MEPEIKIKALMKKYMNGSITPRERWVLMQLWDLYDTAELVQLMEEAGAGLPLQPMELFSQASAEAMAHAIVKQCRAEAAAKAAKRRSLRLKWLKGIAACVLLAAVAVWALQLIRDRQYKAACNITGTNGDVPTSGFYAELKAGNENWRLDSNQTGLLRRYRGMELHNSAGRVTYRHNGIDTGAGTLLGVQEIYTAAQQQYRVQLPGGVQLRLNAQTRIRLESESNGNRVLTVTLLQGELFVQHSGSIPFLLYTTNSAFQTGNSDFDVRILPNATRVVVTRGNLWVRDMRTGNSEQLAVNDAAAVLTLRWGNLLKDTLITHRGVNTAPLVTWKQRSREYNKVPLRQFVYDMGQWYGIRFDKTECLPEKNISVRLCYKAPPEEFIAALEQNGIKVYRTLKGGYAFCDPGPFIKNGRISLRQ
ncbi:FecR family protein [Niabella aquatica]